MRDKDSRLGRLWRNKESWFIPETPGEKEETPGPGELRAWRQEDFPTMAVSLIQSSAIWYPWAPPGMLALWVSGVLRTSCWSVLDAESELAHSRFSCHFSTVSKEKMPESERFSFILQTGVSQPRL